MRVTLRMVLAVLVALTGWGATGGQANACACGAVFSPGSAVAQVPTETVLLTQAGGIETVTMQLAIDSTGDEAGLVVPTPTPATVRLGDPQVFTALDRITRPVHKVRRHLVGEKQPGTVTNTGAAAGARSGGVTELSTVDLGPIQASVLKAGDPQALRRWLSSHGYLIRPEVQRQVDGYVADGWSFVAMKLTPQGKALRGTLPPVVMSFRSTSLVYPMRMSRAARQATAVRTYVFSQHRMQRTDRTAGRGDLQLLYAGRAASAALPASLRATVADAPYLTALSQLFPAPATQIASDFTFARASSDQPYQAVIWDDEYLLSWDQLLLLVMSTILLAIVAAIVVQGRRRRQDRRAS
ncbi:DUF2330 domain-containing protein [Calidifontibacter sp. DB0510]|uniref:DUF2330 domain-containing protein n=1 Tax=Metallococcus carri TaxID=1656884 RepID=A0A967AZF4_9MICO|nr:DUF2330 domain-containing protein [Metallococcus carri]NHN54568.1 DUF2330 domain-containing protein [Metallococcus carri]NOP36593.1 DUF2330 domain-containing protein [Calidifontibacter sp. DB2511S]